MNIQNTQPRSERTWTLDYTPAEVKEIRRLVSDHKFTLIRAAEMVAPKNRVKVRAPKSVEEIDRWFKAQAVAK